MHKLRLLPSTGENSSSVVEVSWEKNWPSEGYFKNQLTNYNMEKVNYPKNSIIHLHQAYLTIQKSKKMVYGDHFLFGQIIESSNPLENIEFYACKKNEFKIYRRKYNVFNG